MIYDMCTTVSDGRSMICVLQYQTADLLYIYYSIRSMIYVLQYQTANL